MRPFRAIPIKRKLTIIIMLTSSAALLLACVSFLTYELILFRGEMTRELSSLAEIIGANSTAALTFRDKKSAEETLYGLKAKQHIVTACIYTSDGDVFATYFRDGGSKNIPPAKPRVDSYSFENGYLILFNEIVLNREKIGTVYLQSDLELMYSRLRQYAGIIVGVMLVSSIVALILSSKLQQVISKPILHLAQIARNVSSKKDYSIRATSTSQDEVGTLITGFNEMLTQIQGRDMELQRAHDLLEGRVDERTKELQQEIAERKRAGEALRQSETRFRSVWENSADGMRLTDEQGTIIAVNKAFCEIVEMRPEELGGKPITFTYAGSEDIEEMLHRYQKRFQERNIEPHSERMVKLRSGKSVYVEVTNSFIELEEKTLLLGMFRDITERKESEQRIQTLAHTITSMNECVVITDMQNNIMAVNPAFMRTYGYREDEILGKNIAVLRSPNNPKGITEEILSETLKDGWNGELMNRRKNGEEFPIILSTSVIRDKQGPPIALVGISRDITEQKNLQRQLDETARQRTEDLSKFAMSVQNAQEEERRRIARELHDDLGQRLSGLKLNMEVLEDAVPKRYRMILDKLRSYKNQINTMIVETRRISSNLRPAALDDFGLLIALRFLCKEFEKVYGLTIQFQADSSLPEHYNTHVEIAMYRIAQEALSNIAKHAEAKNICLQLLHRGDSVALVVQDDGKGFEFQIIQARAAAERGLGLISMKERSELLGGIFHIESAPHKGTALHVEIPLNR